MIDTHKFSDLQQVDGFLRVLVHKTCYSSQGVGKTNHIQLKTSSYIVFVNTTMYNGRRVSRIYDEINGAKSVW
jgi:hypothetical protein